MLFLYSETLDFPRFYQVKVLNLISLPSPRRCCILLSAFSLSSGQDVAFTFTEQVAGVLLLPYTDPRERVNRVQAIRFISNFPPDCNETPRCVKPNLSLASPLVFTLVNKPMVQLAVNNRQSGSLSRLPLFSLLFAEKALRGKKNLPFYSPHYFFLILYFMVLCSAGLPVMQKGSVHGAHWGRQDAVHRPWDWWMLPEISSWCQHPAAN